MANPEHVELLKQGVTRWNRWRLSNPGGKPDLRNANLREANLHNAALQGADLRGANLGKANVIGANLREANLREAFLIRADLREADLQGADLSQADLCEANFRGANLRDANLSQADLREVRLGGADVRKANLGEADLSRAQVLGTNFDQSVFTSACLQDWNLNSDTSFEGVICKYIYLKSEHQERRPREGFFKSGEFSTLLQQTIDTVDLIFKDGIDWQAFFQSFQDLRSQYADQDLSIQAIEKKLGGAFIVRLEVDEDVDKSAIEGDAKQLYESRLKTLEAQYERQLRLQGEQHLEEIQRLIAVERQEKATLMGVLTTMATHQGPKINDFRGAQFVGGFAETVQGNQIGGILNNEAAETPSLAEAAAEIQNLLKQLKVSNPSPTQAQQTAYLDAIIHPTRRERFIGALRSASGAAIEEVPYGAILKALVEGWQMSGG